MLRLFSGQMIYGMRMIHGQGAVTVCFLCNMYLFSDYNYPYIQLLIT
jgi:hypothetical protein